MHEYSCHISTCSSLHLHEHQRIEKSPVSGAPEILLRCRRSFDQDEMIDVPYHQRMRGQEVSILHLGRSPQYRVAISGTCRSVEVDFDLRRSHGNLGTTLDVNGKVCYCAAMTLVAVLRASYVEAFESLTPSACSSFLDLLSWCLFFVSPVI